ncbi:O-antigen ligase family protein [Sessilibacter corallicola]|uniref:O-antigen ligase family protein n=1 Tax=Sessilibacter corallicola TaxID=2904075 RepID=UPI001E54CA73|nr:hypothetical protein [Sessilibacter corallicola]MCE2028486.1 hypothetical protein [Sessilibacter corallicola]
MSVASFYQSKSFKNHWIDFWFGALLLGFYCITVGFLVFPSNSGIQSSYYSLVVIPMFALLPVIRPSKVNLKLLFIFLSAPVYLAISSFWADPNIATAYREPVFFFKLVLLLLLLFLAVRMLLDRNPEFPITWVYVMAFVGGVSAVASLADYLITHHSVLPNKFPRFKGLIWGGDTNRVAAFYTAAFLANLFVFFNASKMYKWLAAVSVVPLVACVLLAQSKVPLAVILCSVFVVIFSALKRGNKLWVLIAFALLLAIGLWLAFGTNTFSRQYSFFIRGEIWSVALEELGSQWFFGAGLNYRVSLVADGTTFGQAHSFIIDAMRFGGIVVVCLLISQIITGLLNAYRHIANPIVMFLLVWWLSGMGTALVEAQQPLIRPSYVWFLYWIPLIMIIQVCDTKQSVRTTTD